MFVIPKAGLTVVDPALMTALPPEGRDVGNDFPMYWLRHVQDHSVTQVPEDRIEQARNSAAEAERKRNEEAVAAAGTAAADAALKTTPTPAKSTAKAGDK